MSFDPQLDKRREIPIEVFNQLCRDKAITDPYVGAQIVIGTLNGELVKSTIKPTRNRSDDIMNSEDVKTLTKRLHTYEKLSDEIQQCVVEIEAVRRVLKYLRNGYTARLSVTVDGVLPIGLSNTLATDVVDKQLSYLMAHHQDLVSQRDKL